MSGYGWCLGGAHFWPNLKLVVLIQLVVIKKRVISHSHFNPFFRASLFENFYFSCQYLLILGRCPLKRFPDSTGQEKRKSVKPYRFQFYICQKLSPKRRRRRIGYGQKHRHINSCYVRGGAQNGR